MDENSLAIGTEALDAELSKLLDWDSDSVLEKISVENKVDGMANILGGDAYDEF